MNHCSYQTLEEFFRSSAGEAATEVGGHLVSCADCYRLAVEVVCRIEEAGVKSRELNSVARAVRDLIQAEERFLRTEVQAHCLVSVLFSLDPEKQKYIIRSDSRVKTRSFIVELVRAARERALSDPAKAASLCNCGLLILVDLLHLNTSVKSDLEGELLTELANARRLQAKRELADEILDRAYRIITQKGTGDPALVARIGSIRASVRLDAGKPDDALLLLHEARKKYEVSETPQMAGRIMVQIADIVSVFDPTDAYRIARESVGHLAGDENLRARACALGIMVESLVEQGRATEALREYKRCRDFLGQFSEPGMHARIQVLEARLSALINDDEEALRLFSDAIDEFYERGLYQAMTNAQLLLLGHYIDRKKWSSALDLCSFAAGEAEIPQGVKDLWRSLQAAIRAKSLALCDLQEARRLLRTEWR